MLTVFVCEHMHQGTSAFSGTASTASLIFGDKVSLGNGRELGQVPGKLTFSLY